jgi:hypothetical protein
MPTSGTTTLVCAINLHYLSKVSREKKKLRSRKGSAKEDLMRIRGFEGEIKRVKK